MTVPQVVHLIPGMQSTMHWAVPKQERMLPEGEESKGLNTERRSNSKSETGMKKTDQDDQDSPMNLPTKDSTRPTLIMVNKWSEEDVRRKFRNYEI